MTFSYDRIASLILIGLGMIATIGMAARGGSSPGFSPPPPPLPPPSLSITTVSLPDGMVIFSYTQTIRAAGGVAPFTWTISSGNLPHSLTFAANAIDSATITGTYSPWPLEQANAWRLFYGGWDGTATPNDRVYSVTTSDFLSFENRVLVIDHRPFSTSII